MREMLEHVIALSEGGLRRLLREYIAYYHQDRIYNPTGKTRRNGGVPKANPHRTQS